MDCKSSIRLPLMFWLGLLVTTATPVMALDWQLDAAELRFGDVLIEQLQIDRAKGTVRAGSIRLAQGTDLGRIDLRCGAAAAPACRRAELDWTLPDVEPLQLVIEFEAQRLTLEGTALQLSLERSGVDGDLLDRWQLQARVPELAALPPLLPHLLGLSSLSGTLELQGRAEPAVQDLHLELRDGALDTPDGRYAAGDLAVSLDLRRRGEAVAIDAEWRGGELLLGPVYLPVPSQAVQLELQGRLAADCLVRIENFAVEQLPAISIHGTGSIDLCMGAAGIDAAITLPRIDLAAAWALGLDSVAGAAGWSGLDVRGVLSGAVELLQGQAIAGRLLLEDAALSDGAERLRINDLNIALDWTEAGRESMLKLDWSGAAIHRLPLGPLGLILVGKDDVLRLEQALAVPVLDGRLLIDALEWRDWRSPNRDLNLSARLEPIGLAALTRSLGWTEFGGALSGRIPGLRVTDGVIELEGGLELALFDGTAQVRGLSIERPFGALPALAADIEFEALDLALLTGAFEIGSMGGRVSGYLRELRLLDWQPVRFDAWFETLDTGRDRRISQKAVDSLSTVSGGGTAVLSGTLLQMFEDFPYRRIGLGCRLERNICVMRGLEVVDGGGYMIIEGRPLPVLNVVGHRRRVDWPQLVAQLIALTES